MANVAQVSLTTPRGMGRLFPFLLVRCERDLEDARGDEGR